MTHDMIKAYGNGGTVFAGPSAVNVYRATAISVALKFYAKTGMKINRAYTPTAMLAAANEITGHSYKRGQYEAAAQGLKEWATKQAAAIAAQQGEPQ